MITNRWRSEYQRRYYVQHRDLICARSRARWLADKATHRAACRARNLKVRAIVLTTLGARCTCCGESCLSMLDVDHVRNDGAAHRIAMRTRGTYAIYRDVIASRFDRTRFQLLCRNCNWSKWKNSGECEHRVVLRGRLTLVA